MLKVLNNNVLYRTFFVGFLSIASLRADVITFLNSPGTALDSVTWDQLGGDQAAIGQTFTATSASGVTVSGMLAGSDGLTSLVCDPVTPVNCSWEAQTSGYSTGDSLIWAEDTNNAGSGPITLSFSAQFGTGAYIQATSAGQFTAALNLYDGSALLGTQTYTSDSNGDPLFLGAADNTREITKAVFSLTSCGSYACDSADLSMDTLQFYSSSSSAPEPATFWLSGTLLVLGFTRIRKSERKKSR